MSGLETLFNHQYRIASKKDNALLPTPKYHEPQMTREEAHNLPWEQFIEKMRPLATVKSSDSDTSYIVTSKYVSWSPEDVNIYAGNPDRSIRELDDFTATEGDQLFGIYQKLTEGVLTQRPAVHVSIGFNPNDFSLAHHSVQQFHSHLYVPISDFRCRMPMRNMPKFYKLAFVEPFSPVAHDLIKHYIGKQKMAALDKNSCHENLGFTSFTFDRTAIKALYGDVRNLYSYLKQCYKDVSKIYTDGDTDSVTGKFVPVEKMQRLERLEKFMEETPVVFRPESYKVLSYLAGHLIPSVPRRSDDPRQLKDPGQTHITRGFSGAFTFRFDTEDDYGHFDLSPRVITTSAVAKTLYGEGRPTEIIKETMNATDAQRATMQSYQQRVVSLVYGNT